MQIRKTLLIQIIGFFVFAPWCKSDEDSFKIVGKAEAYISFELQERDLPHHLSGGSRVLDDGAVEYWTMLINEDIEGEVREAFVEAIKKLVNKSGFEIKKAKRPLLKGGDAKWIVEIASKNDKKIGG